jgi:hypothetical protein
MLEPTFDLRFDLRHTVTGALLSEHTTEAAAIHALDTLGSDQRHYTLWRHAENALESHYTSLPPQMVAKKVIDTNLRLIVVAMIGGAEKSFAITSNAPSIEVLRARLSQHIELVSITPETL